VICSGQNRLAHQTEKTSTYFTFSPWPRTYSQS